ncbi:hypothetical protein F5Y09DRAFT_329065 [Xylaria sp. FL1042]|nr:hypothetical protein F5Y09DRAFT_329065 [Xylaria sp. FL1042]
MWRDATSGPDRLPTKKARLTGTDTQRPGSQDKKAEQVAKTTLQQPKPKPSKRPYASSLELKQIGSGSDSDNNEHQPKRFRLTQKNLALFNKMRRKKGTDKTLKSGAPESTAESSTTKTPPKNLEDFHERYARSRATASLSKLEYTRYANNVGKAPNEATMVFKVGRKLLKKHNDKGYNKVLNQAFTGFLKDVGFSNGLSAPQPDFVEGLEKQEYNPFSVDKYINRAGLYKNDPFFGITIFSWGSAYNRAALMFAWNQALSLIGKPDPSDYAEVTTFITDGTNLNIFIYYAALSDDGFFKYHQYPIKSTNLRDSPGL